MWNTLSQALYWLAPLLHLCLQQKHWLSASNFGSGDPVCAWVSCPCWTHSHAPCVMWGSRLWSPPLSSAGIKIFLPRPGLSVSDHGFMQTQGPSRRWGVSLSRSVSTHHRDLAPACWSKNALAFITEIKFMSPQAAETQMLFHPGFWLWAVALLILSNYVSLG